MRGYYRVAKKYPANRVDGDLAEIVRTKFAEGWPKARIAREFRLHRQTVARICSKSALPNTVPPLQQNFVDSIAKKRGQSTANIDSRLGRIRYTELSSFSTIWTYKNIERHGQKDAANK